MRSLLEKVAWFAEISRPARRRLTPHRFKEQYINKALSTYRDPTYLEIGVRQGESFRVVKAERKIGIDPVRTKQMETLKAGEEFFAMTSDTFFANHGSRVLEKASIHVALIDGLHEFRQAARDLVHLEPYMRPDGIVFFDDFNPRTRKRGANAPTGGAWNGDVWKVAALLSTARSDLKFWTVDADEGVGVVAGFDSGETGDMTQAMDSCDILDYAYLDANRASLLHLITPSAFEAVLTRLRDDAFR